MKKYAIGAVSVMVVAAMVFGASTVMAAKPQQVIKHSNGFPSGQHFNLNLHGKNPLIYTGDPGPGGNSVIIALSGNSTIEYLSNKKNNSKTELYVIDPLTEQFAGADAAQVYLPYNIKDESDNITKSARGYYVFGRILGKPKNNATSDNASHILIYPNIVVAASNVTDNYTWPWPLYDGEVQLDLGIITTQGNVGITDPAGFYRFDPPTDDPDEKGKGQKRGKSKAKEITDLFLWSGYVSDNVSLDCNGNGYLDEGDMACYEHLEWEPGGTFEEWLEHLVDTGQANYVDKQWIFDIAEMIITGQDVVNDGTKLFQIRFYPVETTEFESPHIGP